VSDNLGVLGLLDDAYVIDWAYAFVEKQTWCLPLLQALVEKWPFVADVALAGTPPMPLDRFSQYVAGACLHSLFTEGQPALLVLRENAGFGVIAAFFAGVQCARIQGDSLEEEIGGWPINQPVIVSDGQEQFKALFKGLDEIGDRQKNAG
jgi:hypothetical protein